MKWASGDEKKERRCRYLEDQKYRAKSSTLATKERPIWNQILHFLSLFFLFFFFLLFNFFSPNKKYKPNKAVNITKISLFPFISLSLLLDPNIEFTNSESIRIWFDVDEDERVRIRGRRKWRRRR